VLAGQGGRDPLFHPQLTRPGNLIGAARQRRRDLAAALAFAGVRGVRFQQDAGLQRLLRRMLAGGDQGGSCPALFIAEGHDEFLYGGIVPGHESAPSLGPTPSSQ